MTSFFASLSSTSPAECNLNIHIFQEWIRTSLRLTVTESFLVFSTQGQDCERGSWLLCQRQAGGAVAFFVARNGAWLRGTREQDQPERCWANQDGCFGLRWPLVFWSQRPKRSLWTWSQRDWECQALCRLVALSPALICFRFAAGVAGDQPVSSHQKRPIIHSSRIMTHS